MHGDQDNMGFTREELNDLLGYDFYQFPGVNMQDGFDMTVPTNQQMATPRSNLPDVRLHNVPRPPLY